MKKSLSSLFVLTTLLTLMSCGGGNSSVSDTSSSSNSSNTEDKFDISVSSVRDAIQRLGEKNANFTLEYSVETNSSSEYYDAYYTKDYFVNLSDGDGYLNENGGVSSIYYNEETEEVARSILLTDSSGNGYTDYHDVNDGFDALDVSLAKDVEGKENTIDLSAKKLILRLFDIMGVSRSNYLYLKSATAVLAGDTLNDLSFVVLLENNEKKVSSDYYVYVTNAGQTLFDPLEDLVENPLPAFEPTDEEKEVKRLFEANNYIQEDDLDGDGTIDEYGYFNPQYYFAKFTEAYAKQDPLTAAAYETGYVTIKNKTMDYAVGVSSTTGEYVYKELIFNGAYQFYLTEDELGWNLLTREDPDNPGHAQTSVNSDSTDITEIMNYPSRMTMFSNFQYFSEEGDGEYITTYSPIIQNFMINFNLTDSLSDYTIDSLSFHYEEAESDLLKIVTFRIDLNGGANYYETTFSSFGEGEYGPIEDLLNSNGLKD